MQYFFNERGIPRLGRMLGIALAVIIGINVLLGSWFIVPSNYKGIVVRLGSVDREVSDGLHWKIPLIETAYEISLRADSVKVENAAGGTHDLQPVHVSMTVRYSILPQFVKHVFLNYAKDGNMDNYVMTATTETFKAVTAKYSAPNLIIQRANVSSDVFNTLQAKVKQYGLQIQNIDMTDFAFEKEYMGAVNAKVREEQNMATQANVLKRIEIEQQQKVVTAKAEAESTQARATAEAFAVTAVAGAKAKAIELEGKALRENSNVAELRRIEVEMVRAKQWKGEVPTHMYGSAPIPFVTPGK